MADKFNESKKFVQNQLFNASVTGSTIEDFSQNVVLLPVSNVSSVNTVNSTSESYSKYTSTNTRERQWPIHPLQSQTSFMEPLSLIPNVISNTTLQSNNSGKYFDTTGQDKDKFYIGLEKTVQSTSPPNTVTLPPSNFYFSNITNASPVTNTNSNVSIIKTLDSVQKPPGSENFSSEATGISKNVYRKSDFNRVAYAQVPGLMTKTNSFNVLPMLNSVMTSNDPILLPKNSSSLQASDSLIKMSKTQSIDSTTLYTCSNTENQKTLSTQNIESISAMLLNQSTSVNSSSIMNPVTISSEVYSQVPQNQGKNFLNTSGFISQKCRPVYHHWFFRKDVEHCVTWQPFSMRDSLILEDAFVSPHLSPETLVATDGGRFDVNLLRRERFPIYWSGAPTEVRRCSWFFKDVNDVRYTPFDENIATLLEERYKNVFESNTWNYKIELSNGESLVMVGPDVLLLFPTSQIPDPWDNDKAQVCPKVVKRGMDEFSIDEGEPEKIDHLLLLVHGIGSVCDLKFRSVEQVVDEFRNISTQLLSSHYQTSSNKGVVHRIEVLPISWHSKLHSEDTGIDAKLKTITLGSIPRLRDFTNNTLLDILLYTSPRYCQTILTSVGSELNRVFDLFKNRNPLFQGNVFLGGHSLGSLILFDLLCHQKKEENNEFENSSSTVIAESKPNRRLSSLMLEAGSAQSQLIFPVLSFRPTALFALGSPIGMFLAIRGLDKLGAEFCFPTCSGFFNIFHPYDPVAYRIEPLINLELNKLKPVLIPHHKGRKRMHLELKDTVSRVGSDLKHKLIDSVKTTWNTLFQMGTLNKQDNETTNLDSYSEKNDSITNSDNSRHSNLQTDDNENSKIYFGKLNNNYRIDYVLQEAPFEIFNEYIFALTSHVCYWESEDTILLILKEIYKSINILPDNNGMLDQLPATGDILQLQTANSFLIPNQQMTKTKLALERSNEGIPTGVNPTMSIISNANLEPPPTSSATGMNPTMPIISNPNLGPPPTTGFYRKT